jgi:hypothetical protein
MSLDDVRHLRDMVDEREKRYDQLRQEQEKRYEQRFQSSETALVNARDSINRRLDLLNELRQGVATEAEIKALTKVVDDLKDRINIRDGKSSGLSAGWAVLVGAAMLALAIFAAFGG